MTETTNEGKTVRVCLCKSCTEKREMTREQKLSKQLWEQDAIDYIVPNQNECTGPDKNNNCTHERFNSPCNAQWSGIDQSYGCQRYG